jgi:hypothetical protein
MFPGIGVGDGGDGDNRLSSSFVDERQVHKCERSKKKRGRLKKKTELFCSPAEIA